MKYFKTVLLVICLSFNVTCFASDIKVNIDDKYIDFDVQPIIQDNRTLVPMRKIFEELGCDVEWLAETQTVIATKNSKIIALQIGKNRIISNDIETGETVVTEIDTVPIIHNNRTLVPVRVISECLGYSVDWKDEEQTVIIITEKIEI